MEKRIIMMGILLGCASLNAALVSDNEFSFSRRISVPEFLPNYYKPLFEAGDLVADRRLSHDEREMVFFSSKDEKLKLTLSYRGCDQSQQAELFNDFITYLNQVISTNSGRFLMISENEVVAEVFEEGIQCRAFGFLLPFSMHIWDFEVSPDKQAPFDQLHFMINKQRYLNALKLGPRVMGDWSESVYQHAVDLLANDQKDKALEILENHIQSAPQDYKAQTQFFSITPDPNASSRSAFAVYQNAENEEFINQAAEFLDKKIISIDEFSPLIMGESGLQLILLPIPPCNPWILESSAKVFEEITEIPARVFRLDDPWVWGDFDRVSHEMEARDLIVQANGNPVDFRNWTVDRYIEELEKVVETKDALSSYPIQNLMTKIQNEPGQYFTKPYLEQLGSTLSKIRSSDTRTMYVGITEADLYSGDEGFVFSDTAGQGKTSVALLSYAMMQGVESGDPPSRSRLSDRIGKELVSAALQQLGVRRSIDPRCPYSYATGLERLDQKTKELSPLVKRAIEKLNKTPSLRLK